ncbi:MAG: TCR/Tet family MFS transporter [Asticcacaulis sp.]|uniref:TCR/Tet family MFS transporter n=1 Tax=Asticcacaulis sp. TaxID=1872648 RepID=UPI0039E69572
MPEAPAHPRKAAAAFILVTVFLDMLSIGVIIPVLPNLIKSFLNGSVSEAGLWTGIFGAAWGLAQFLFTPVQGGLSDAIGRRPVVLASNFGTGVDFLFMALAPGLWWLLIGRIISGMTSASISTAYAYMSDVTPPEKRAGVYGLMGAAFGVGFVVGPSLGGILGGGLNWQFIQFSGDHHYPFFFAAILSLCNFLYGLFVLPESLPEDRRKPFSFHTANPLGAIRFLARSGQVMRLSLMYFLLMFGQSVFPTTMVLYADYRFGWGVTQVGLMLAVVGILSAIVQGGLTGLVTRRIGERKAMYVGLIASLIAYAGYGLATNGLMFVAFIAIGCLGGLAMPNIQSLMSSKVDPKEQGTLQGSNMSLSTMGNIVAPLIFGLVLATVTKAGVPMAFSGAAFLLAGVCTLLALGLATGVKQSLKVEAGYSEETAE